MLFSFVKVEQVWDFFFFFGGLHQGRQALCSSAGGSHHNEGTVVVWGLEGLLIFLFPDETQHGGVQEPVLLLQIKPPGG